MKMFSVAENLLPATFREYLNAMVDIALTLYNASEHDKLNFAVGDITYNSDPKSFLISSDIDCPGSMVSYGVMCGEYIIIQYYTVIRFVESNITYNMD